MIVDPRGAPRRGNVGQPKSAGVPSDEITGQARSHRWRERAPGGPDRAPVQGPDENLTRFPRAEHAVHPVGLDGCPSAVEAQAVPTVIQCTVIRQQMRLS